MSTQPEPPQSIDVPAILKAIETATDSLAQLMADVGYPARIQEEVRSTKPDRSW